ncbi:choice-of-anchor D domain-containing protein [Kribbella sp. NPDC056861]|uniref:choice-of-anchor D domain-containing protein n=1 Tax=Kribbella sp. NPDC056861 TaxID=3154857 RepID=UPI00341268FE
MHRRIPRARTLILTGVLLTATINLGAVVPVALVASAAEVQVLSVPDGGGDPAAASAPAISGNGRYVAFESKTQLDPGVRPVPGDPVNVYVRDRRSPGHTVLISRGVPQTALASFRGRAAPIRRTAANEELGNGDSGQPSISADGRYVAFDSVARNLQDGYWPSGRRVLLCDRDPDGDGIFDERRPDESMDYAYEHFSPVPLSGTPPDGAKPSLSADADVISWQETADDAELSDVVVARIGKDPAGRPYPPDPDLFTRPLQNLPTALGTEEAPHVSADGGTVVFTALVPTPPIGRLSTVQAFELATARIDRVDYGPDGDLTGLGHHPVISADGRVVAFEQDPGIVGAVSTVVVDRDPDGDGALGPGGGASVTASVASADVNGLPQEGRAPALSSDGRYVAFESSAANMHGDYGESGRTAIVLRDLTVDAERAVAGLPRLAGELGSPAAVADCGSQDASACPAEGPSQAPQLSADGAVLTFSSAGDDLLPEPCCAGAVFARAFRPGLLSDPVDFGSVVVGTTVTRTVVLRHIGFGPVRVGAITVTGPDARYFALTGAENCVGAMLHETGTCAVSVTFTPGAGGEQQAGLRIELPDGTATTAQLVAVGTDAPVDPPTSPPTEPPPPEPPGESGGLVVSPEPVIFAGAGTALVARPAQTLTVRNAATTSITVTEVVVLEGPRFTAGDFAVAGNTCAGTVLSPGGSCTIQVTTTPQNAGQRNGVLDIVTADLTYRHLVALRSTATAPTLTTDPAVVRPNRVVTVSGRNFPPGQAITLTFVTPGARSSSIALAQPDGTFSQQMLVFPQTSAGTWPVTAGVGGTSVRAQSPLLVVPGSYQPPGFTSRR